MCVFLRVFVSFVVKLFAFFRAFVFVVKLFAFLRAFVSFVVGL